MISLPRSLKVSPDSRIIMEVVSTVPVKINSCAILHNQIESEPPFKAPS